jgi:regulator of RNase E activity RraA
MPVEVSATTCQQLMQSSTATLTSILRSHGLKNTFMHGVAPLGPGMKMAGPAFTLRYIPAREDVNDVPMDNLKDVQRVGIEQVPNGAVFVIDARGQTGSGTMGSILAKRLQVRGAAGIVTDGAYRDTPNIVASGLPAYAAAMNANANKTIHYPSEIQVPVACGEVAVFPGDIIVGDEEGVVVIPAHLADEVAQAAAEMELKETFLLEKISSGASIVGTYPPDEATLAEYAVWKEKRQTS